MDYLHLVLGGPSFDTRIPDWQNQIWFWDDLTVGPVPPTQTLEELTNLRIAYWARPTPLSRLPNSRDRRAIRRQERQREERAKRRDQCLRDLDSSKAIIWCGTNRRETLMLLHLLHFIQRPEHVSIVPCDAVGIPRLRADRLAKLFAKRRQVTRELLEEARDAWKRFTAPDPMQLQRLTGSFAPVLHRMFADYPSVRNGLSQTENWALRRISHGKSLGKIESELVFRPDSMGDGTLRERVAEFLSDREPLIEYADGTSPEGGFDRHRPITLTRFGKQVLRGARDYIAANGIDRWIGGVHLQGHSVPWRYNAQTKRLVVV